MSSTLIGDTQVIINPYVTLIQGDDVVVLEKEQARELKILLDFEDF